MAIREPESRDATSEAGEERRPGTPKNDPAGSIVSTIELIMGAVRRRDARTAPSVGRVPIYCDGKLTAFVHRNVRNPGASADAGAQHPRSDSHLKRAIEAAMRKDCPHAASHIRLSVEGGIVVLSGEVENVHDKMALRRIVANTEGTIAIIDHVWISCE